MHPIKEYPFMSAASLRTRKLPFLHKSGHMHMVEESRPTASLTVDISAEQSETTSTR